MRDEILEREKQFWEATKRRDSATATRLTDDSCIVMGPQGMDEIKREAIGPMIADAPYEIERYAFDEQGVHFRMLTDDVAVVAYKVNERAFVDGEACELDAYEATVWLRRDGEWVAALHTETLPGDPFGRDRRAQKKRKTATVKAAKKPTRERTRTASAGAAKRRQRA